ncbi:response regulator [Paenibacillus piri]|nr:response regulator [Paenibacillus piri]
MYKMLIVDDEQFVLDTISVTYPWDQYGITNIDVAGSGAKALELFKTEPADIVITDIRMPGMSGLELINEIKKISNKTKFILLSGHSEFAYAQQAIQSQVLEYLLKPVKEKELLATIQRALEGIRKEWDEIVSYQRAQYSLRENLPLLRQTLLKELLHGKKYRKETLDHKLDMLEVPIRSGSPFSIMAIRLEKGFERFDYDDLDLIEYAVTNIVEEVFGEYFRLWKCKDVHDYLILIIHPLETEQNLFAADAEVHYILENCALQLQNCVKNYLNGNITVLLSPWGEFPNDTAAFYQNALLDLRMHLENDNGYYISPFNRKKPSLMTPLYNLYEPPTVLHLLEAGRWNDAEAKLIRIFTELEADPALNREHILEAALLIAYAATYITHKSGHYLTDLSFFRQDLYSELEHIGSVNHLKKWTFDILSSIRRKVVEDFQNNQTSIMHQVRTFIERHLLSDISLQSIADFVHLHPAYLSKIYKDESGECISDYICRLRMDKAAYLLTTSEDKVNDIAAQVGYVNPSHFIKVFRKHFSVTPNEYRRGNEG